MGLSKLEQETIATYNNAEREADVYTANKPLWEYLEDQGYQAYREYHHDGQLVAKSFKVPKNWVKVRKPRRVAPETAANLQGRMPGKVKTRPTSG